MSRLDVVHAAIGISNGVGRIDSNRLAMVLDRKSKLTRAPERIAKMIVGDDIVGLGADQFGACPDDTA